MNEEQLRQIRRAAGRISSGATVDYVDERDLHYIGHQIQLGFNATLEGNVITGTLDSSVANYELLPNTNYLINIYLPLATLTGDLDDSYEIVLKDKDGNNININCIMQEDIDETATVGDLCQIQNFDAGIGFSWTFTGYYREITKDDEVVRVISTDIIVRETVSAMTGSNLHINLLNGKLKRGNVVICTSDYEMNGTVYSKGHLYLITGELVEGELILDTEDITVS